ncbi:hypothetical protein Acr_00g0026230 [Actinidia rufa]|uniref:Uncharacterized protein n=1 Tax=Actinidia rufa TaxID=165716 RepID=A0A7J0DFH6_9ERIC|nr:hypothetical protein Acr_00g0026230 [Actinidia rufa]
MRKEIEDRYPQRFYCCIGNFSPSFVQTIDVLTAITEKVRPAVGAISGKTAIRCVGAVRGNFDMQVTFCLLTLLGISAGHCITSKLQRSYYSELAEQRQLVSRMTLARMTIVFDNDYFELRREDFLSLLCIDSLAEISALARPVYKGLHRAPAQGNMELNRAQLLVHDNEAMERFRAKHGIPADVSYIVLGRSRDMSKEDKIFNFMAGLQNWAQLELHHLGVKDLSSAIVVADGLLDYKLDNSSTSEFKENKSGGKNGKYNDSKSKDG